MAEIDEREYTDSNGNTTKLRNITGSKVTIWYKDESIAEASDCATREHPPSRKNEPPYWAITGIKAASDKVIEIIAFLHDNGETIVTLTEIVSRLLESEDRDPDILFGVEQKQELA